MIQSNASKKKRTGFHPLLKGNPATALDEPYSVVITEGSVQKYFGKEEPIGKVLDFRNNDVRSVKIHFDSFHL